MLVGGIDGHRTDLSSMVMLKDNHIWSSGSITRAISQTRAISGFTLLLDVEVQTEAEADEAIEAGADVIMLDNMEGRELVDVAQRLKERWSGKRKFLLETSGGIEEHNLTERAVNREFTGSTTVASLMAYCYFSSRCSQHQRCPPVGTTCGLLTQDSNTQININSQWYK